MKASTTRSVGPHKKGTAASGAHNAAAGDHEHSVIFRFHTTERWMHWAIAIPFLGCFSTALVLVLVYNPEPTRPYRDIFAMAHRVFGTCLVIFPPLVLLTSWRRLKVHLGNIKTAWGWTWEDIKWLLLMLPAALVRRISLPEQGKFNAAEKLNFMVVMTTYPLFIVTGVMLLLPQGPWRVLGVMLPWVAHFLLAAVATPLLLGHLFMALINPETRVGLSGMITGYVQRRWAKHHYARWYREQADHQKGKQVPLPTDAHAQWPRAGAEDAGPSVDSGLYGVLYGSDVGSSSVGAPVSGAQTNSELLDFGDDEKTVVRQTPRPPRGAASRHRS